MELFRHNEDAYRAAVCLLRETGKAAVVHPTGTGKSFIGFRLCEENPKETVCWVSPSEYIFRTQIENWERAGGDPLGNVTFFTYAKLMNLSDAELAALSPRYIVLDEFHRAGADCWGTGVRRLIAACPYAGILGLSATAIRYLDNQRNMADELFDGNIASEMTLGEAIVRGILNPPKYVMTVFSLENDLKKAEKRVRRQRSAVIRDECDRYLEALRRALEKAEGLNDIFRRHITDAEGKYIVFCSGYEHMRQMIELVPEWFAGIDDDPHVYTAYSDDPETSVDFARFKADESHHLKLLFCIDMLNEGIHVDDVSGVLLLRPTISPIVYKQQIGRALSANKKKTPVIFDIVMNIENLFSVDAIEEEMKVAATYYRSLGMEDEIVNENFRVIDEVRDCLSLFDRLNDTLSASWELMFRQAEKYHAAYGNLDVPKRYQTEEGYSLGRWVFIQRNIRRGTIPGTLTQERIRKLDRLGMVWDSAGDLSFSRYYAAAEKYRAENGNLDVPARYTDGGGIALGAWIANIRLWNRAGIRKKYLTEERKEKLDRLGMVWSVPDAMWEKGYRHAEEYFAAYGNLCVLSSYVSPDGFRLGAWLCAQRNLRGAPADAERLGRLEKIGFRQGNVFDNRWNDVYRSVKAYYDAHGDLEIPLHYTDDSGVALADWLNLQRNRFYAGKLKAERKEKLDRVGMVWDREDPWMFRYELLRQYCEEHDGQKIPQKKAVCGVYLGRWLSEQRKKSAQGALSPEKASLIAALPPQEEDEEDVWQAAYQDAAAFYAEHGHLRVPREFVGKSGRKLSSWLDVQRKRKRKGTLSAEQEKLLAKLHFVFVPESDFQVGMRHAREYAQKFGDLSVIWRYFSPDGYGLGKWICKQRKRYATGDMPDDQREQLDNIGMIWSSRKKESEM